MTEKSTTPEPNLYQRIAPFLWIVWLLPILIFGWLIFSLSDGSLRSDWLDREGGYVLSWWALATVAGVGVMPLLFRLVHALPDRGYSVARPAGLMLTGFLYWLMTSLGLMQNATGGIVTAWVLVVIFGAIAWLKWEHRPTRRELGVWFRDQLPLIIIVEILFIVAFAGWAYVQAHNPEIITTEKPMEVAFINGIRNSESFPPKDPWLAGYSISYYYFGYIITAGLADLSDISTGTAFNLITSLIFAMTAIGALGLTYNLIRAVGHRTKWRSGSRAGAIGAGLLAATMVVLLGNLGTYLIELPYRGYTDDTALVEIDQSYFDFWDVEDRIQPDDLDDDGIIDWEDNPQDFGDGWEFWWWFRYSRVIQDRDLRDNPFSVQPIAEFPQFSFILSDNHPHVLALPFAMLALALAAGLALRPEPLQRWELLVYAVFIGGMVFMNAWDAVYIVIAVGAEALRRLLTSDTARLSGFRELTDIIGLARRREWNLYLITPVALVLFVAIIVLQVSAFAEMPTLLRWLLWPILSALITPFVNWLLDDTDWSHVFRFGALLSILSYILYFPWHISFTSQANGFYPTIIFPTRWQQFFLQFGIFMIVISLFLIMDLIRSWRLLNKGLFLAVVGIGVFLTFAVPLLATNVIDARCPLTAGQEGQIGQIDNELDRSLCDARIRLFGGLEFDGEDLYTKVIERRLGALPSHLFLFIVMGYAAGRLFGNGIDDSAIEGRMPPGLAVALLLMAAGATLAFLPDLVYVRDVFSVRINTVFKFYYQAWVLFSIGTAYAVYALMNARPRLKPEAPHRIDINVLGQRVMVAVIVSPLLVAGLLYPYFAIQSRAIHDTARRPGQVNADAPLTLVGEPSIVGRVSADDFEVLQCLADLEPYGSNATIVEAPFRGGYWSAEPPWSRFSAFTGLPTLIGWSNHESQWRGDSYQTIDGVGVDQRIVDADTLYRTTEWEQAQTIIDQYGIDYVVIGDLERRRYNQPSDSRGLDKFAQIFDPVCQSGAVAVYAVSAE